MKMDILADPRIDTFLKEFFAHREAISRHPLAKQRELDCEFVRQRNTCTEKLHRIENIEVVGKDNHKIPVRIYIPRDERNLPVIVYFHQGGWVFGGIEESDAVARRLANHLNCIVASVGYRLAPEHPFPKPLEDCYAVTKWMANNAHTYGGDKSCVSVAGESAGGNLAAAVALMSHDLKEFQLAAQLLINPVISSTIHDHVYDSCPDHYFITKEAMKFFWSMYTPQPNDAKHPYASVDYRVKCENLPPALIVEAEYDPLNFDIDRYAAKLQKAKVPVTKIIIPKVLHCCLYLYFYTEEEKVAWTKQISEAFHKLISKRLV